MKARILFALMFIASVVIFTACGSDDSDPPPHIVGTWGLDSYIMTNLPTGFTSNEGAILLLSQITFGGVPIEAYTLDIMANGSYNRKIEVPGPSIVDNGKWTVQNEEELILDSDEADTDESWSIERDENSQLWISQPVQFLLIEDAILDTLTQDYVDSLSIEEFNELFSQVSLDLVYAFEK